MSDPNITLVMRAWLQGRAANTVQSYRRTIEQFLALLDKPLATIAVSDVERFAASLADLAPSSQGQRLAAVKSFLKFAYAMGVTSEDAGRLARLPAKPDTLSQRYVARGQVRALLEAATDPFAHALILTLYATGARITEACTMRWRDASPDGDDVIITIHGKGGKTRHVRIGCGTWETVQRLRADAPHGALVFRGMDRQRGYHLVKKAAKSAGLPDAFSPHWLRHAHATHAIEAGAAIDLIQRDLGHASVATTSKYLDARPQDSSARYLGL